MPTPYPATENEASAHPPLSPGFLLAAMLDDHVDVNRPDICAFSSCSKWGLLFIAVRGPLITVASLVEYGL